MSYTPGPWHRNIRANGKYPVVFAGRNQHVATATQQTEPADTEANIDLIAAAPDLLEALQTMVKAFHTYAPKTEGAEYNCVIEARAAIAKATGN